VSGVVALPSACWPELRYHAGARSVLPEDHIVLEDDLEPEALRQRLRAAAHKALGRQRMRLPTDERAIALVAEALGALPGPRRGKGRAGAPRPPRSLGARIDELRGSGCLDPEQRRLAERTLEGRPTLLRGVAGSGKSLLLARGLVNLLHHVANREPKDEERDPYRVLVTCYNRTLIPLLRRQAEGFAKMEGLDLARFEIDIVHFEGVLSRLKQHWGLHVPRCTPQDDGDRLPGIVEQVDALFAEGVATEEEVLWDFVFVDEAQDLHPEGLRLLQRLSRTHPKTGEHGIALFYDDAQNVYGRPRPIWRDLGIHVTGGRTVALQRSRRSSRPIVTFGFNVLLGTVSEGERPTGAKAYADLSWLRENDLVIETDAGVVVDFARRRGPEPELYIADDVQSEEDEIVTRIKDLVRAEDVRPHEIVVQSARSWDYLRGIEQRLAEADIATHWVEGAKDELIIKDGYVTLSTIQSAKGYDAPVAFVIGAQEFGQALEERARFYVGATRAQLLLVVTGYGPPTGLLGEMREVKRRLPALQAGVEK